LGGFATLADCLYINDMNYVFIDLENDESDILKSNVFTDAANKKGLYKVVNKNGCKNLCWVK
jgi:hypothetical protein